ncbi:siderophore ABC transporter substrate-binding protein [Roseibium sp.]|uniref:siderophore ABC transporter substrate-binding protein n=1 Tax=Roseibium sp. TaxID=1936156 RepID=UPI003A978E0A
MRAVRLSILAFAFSLIAFGAHAEDVAIETARGTVTLESNPETLAVLDIAALDTLTALGVEVDGIPDNVFVNYLRDSLGETNVVGSLFEPDFEAINALQPDLVIAGGRSSTRVEELSALAPTIDMTIWGDGLIEQGRKRLKAYGELFGRQPRAADLDAKLLQAVEHLRQTTEAAGTALIVLTNGPKISVYGPSSRFGWIHTELGIRAAASNISASTHGEAVSFEFLRKVEPDWLIVIDRAAAIGAESELAAQTLDNKLVQETKAWKTHQIIYLNAANVYISAGGYQSLMGTLSELQTSFSADR